MSVDLNALGKGIHRHIQEQDFQFGVEAERERIIKLLEEARDECACYEVGMPICRHTPTVDETIALIKGEK